MRLGQRRVLAIVALVAWSVVAPGLASRLVVQKPLASSDAIFVLAGSTAYPERAGAAAELYRAGVSSRIVLTDDGLRSGWSVKEEATIPYVELARRILVARGVPADAIEILRPTVSATIAEARLLGDAAAQRRWRSLVLVTSGWHTRRALWTFEHVFAGRRLETRLGIVAARNRVHGLPEALWWLTPLGWRDVAGEYLKAVYYRIAY